MTDMELQTTLDPIEMDMGDPEIIYSPVLPNPEGEPTDDLTKVTIQGDIYKIKDPEVHDWARAEEKPTYTKEEVGLGNVDNTSDLNKPISTATQTALDNKVDKVAGKGLSEEDFTHTLKDKLDGIEAGAEVNTVNSVAGKTGNVTLDKSDVGLGNVDNTSDMNKPVSTATQEALQGLANATQTALNGKVDKVEGYGLSENDYSDEEKALVGTIEDKLGKTETAVNANGLALVTPVNDNAPYIYRPTPVKESFKALMKKIVGASVVWNQLVDSNTTSVTIASGHRYIAKINGTLIFGTSDGTAITVSANDYFTDLTAMFGTTIADYIYTLEQATAGSGISWLQSYGFFTEDYYAYKQNKLESGCVSAKKIYGKNLQPFNMAEAKTLNTRGTWVNNTYTWAGVVYEVMADGSINISGSATENSLFYYQKTELPSNCFGDITISGLSSVTNMIWNAIQLLDKDDNVIARLDGGASDKADKTFSIKDYPNVKYINVSIKRRVNSSTISGTCKLQIEVNSTATSFEPYIAPTTYPISPITLRGAFKLSTDKLTVDGDEYNADGTVTRKYGTETYDGSSDEGWNVEQSGTTYRFKHTIEGAYSENGQRTPVICDKAIYISSGNAVGGAFIYGANNSAILYLIIDQSITTVEAFRTYLASNPLSVIFEKATPTTEQTTPFTETEIVGSTEEFIDYEVAQSNRDVAIPVGTDTDYYQEMKLPPLPTTSGNHNLIYNPSTGFGWT